MRPPRGLERRFDVPPGAVLPDLTGLDGITTSEEPGTTHLHATYYDTEDLRLAGHGIALRRRVGGDDQGWHLRVRLDGARRSERWLPLDSATAFVPEPLADRVRSVVGEHELRPVVILNTTRVERRLLDADGEPLAMLTDDSVHGDRVCPEPARITWREVDIELMDDDGTLLDAISARLESAALSRSHHASKLERALDGRSGPPAPAALTGTYGSAGRAISCYLRRHVDGLVAQEAGVRRDEADAVHRMRAAADRLHCATATFGPLVAPRRAEHLRAELGWLGAVLGQPRDIEVLVDRLRGLVTAQPEALIVGPVHELIDSRLGAAHTDARGDVLSAMDSGRYRQLLDDLAAVVAEPPPAAEPRLAARNVLPDVLAHACQRFATAAGAVGGATDRDDRDRLLQAAGLAATRARFAGEAVTPVLGTAAERVARRMAAVQKALGAHRDSVMAREALWELGCHARQAGEDGFTFGLLHGLERARAESAERAYRRLVRTALRGWEGPRRPFAPALHARHPHRDCRTG